jgi:hypothetical protein
MRCSEWKANRRNLIVRKQSACIALQVTSQFTVRVAGKIIRHYSDLRGV